MMHNRFLSLLTFVLVAVGAVLFPHSSHAAQIYVSPASGSYSVGSTVSVSIKVDTSGKAVNTGEVTVSYSTDTLQLVSASQGGTFSLATPGSPQQSAGSVYLGGGVPSPGYTGSGGVLGTLSFRVKAAGTGKVTLSNGKALLNDGLGTDAFQGASGAQYTFITSSVPVSTVVGAPIISSVSHPDQRAWYAVSSPSFKWVPPNGTEAVSFEFDQDKETVPDRVADKAEGSSIVYPQIADGVWYFHIRARVDGTFGPASHYRVQIDTVPPEKFALNTSTDVNGIPTVQFVTTDALSGIAHYAVNVDDVVIAENATSSITISSIARGRHTITVIAYDHAGNIREASATIYVDKNVMISLNFIILLLLLNLLITILLLVLIWLEIEDRRRRAPIGDRVKRAQHDIDSQLEKLKDHVRGELGSLSGDTPRDRETSS